MVAALGRARDLSVQRLPLRAKGQTRVEIVAVKDYVAQRAVAHLRLHLAL